MRTAVLLLALLVLISLSHGENILRRAGDKISEGFDKVKDWAADTYAGQFALGSQDMYRAYDDMQKANWKDSDKYFHARGNFEAAQRGPGGARAAEIISDLRETMNQQSGPYRHREMSAEQHRADSAADQAVNRWGREGGDPNVYRPRGLPDEF